MHLTLGIANNLRFLITEVSTQLNHLLAHIESGAYLQEQDMLDRTGYANNLNARIHQACAQQIAKYPNDQTMMRSIRSVELISAELERMTELSRECEEWMTIPFAISRSKKSTYAELINRVIKGLNLIEPAIHENDTDLALKLGRIEEQLDEDYKKILNQCITALKKKKKDTESLIYLLFVAQNVEQLGDSLLRIGEAIISANIGQLVNIERYYALQASVAELNHAHNDNVLIEPIAQTRSGSNISGVKHRKTKKDDYLAVFKDGEKQKVKEERQGVKNWHEIYPGLAPRILSYHKKGKSASLLIEHLSGFTFEQLVLTHPELLEEAFEQLSQTLKSVWTQTQIEQPATANFIGQLNKRLPSVYRVHPEFEQSACQIGEHAQPAFQTLLNQAKEIESQLQSPYSVYIHGDFNLDNILYDPEDGKINFIDLHRSRYQDYTQDISVFMVSNYRLQTLDRSIRNRIMVLAQAFYRFARKFAKKSGDTDFDFRLALGLARSFASSTRFILDKSLAQSMFLRARYLIEQIVQTDLKKKDKYKLPVKELFVG